MGTNGDAAVRLNQVSDLRLIIDSTPALIHTGLPDGWLDFFNHTWLTYVGQPLERLQGWKWTAFIHPDDVEGIVESWRASLASGEPFLHEARVLRADGQYRWMLHHKVALCDECGEIVKWYGSSIDIEDRKRAEEEIRLREQQLLGIIDTVPSFLWSVSPGGEPTHISQRALDYSGMASEQFLQLGWKDFIHPDDWEETARAFSTAIQTGQPYQAIHRLRRADGVYRWHQARGEALRDGEGSIVQWYGISVDIDEQRRAEDHLRELRAKLARASRIAAVAELSASIAHELNQPLTSVMANAQAASRWLSISPPNTSEAVTSIERVVRDGRAADARMQQIRALFTNDPVEKKGARVSDMISEAIRLIREDSSKAEVTIDCRIDDDLPQVLVDTAQVQEVLINLVSNAIEAMTNNVRPPYLTIMAHLGDDREVLIKLIDNGPGLDETEKIFDAFVTTKQKGMGIGLAISRSIIEAHGGKLWAENNPEFGAKFTIKLPTAG
jgi:PAS domain S-box-containing protein